MTDVVIELRTDTKPSHMYASFITSQNSLIPGGHLAYDVAAVWMHRLHQHMLCCSLRMRPLPRKVMRVPCKKFMINEL